MEKIIYLLQRDPAEDIGTFGERLRGRLAPQLQTLGARGMKLNFADSEVLAGAGLKQTHAQPPVEAFLQLWLDSAVASLRKPFDAAITAQVQGFSAYLVTESQPLVNRKHRAIPGARTSGFAQMALFRRPATLDYAQWLDIWHNSHTQIAIETQSTFEYIQNVVIRRLSVAGADYDAIVEECFPQAALTDPLAFFDAPGDEAKFKKNLERMMWSVGRFIDMTRIDVTPTSQYPMF